MRALMIREDVPPSELRRLAKNEDDPRLARRLLAIAAALEGMSREAVARIAGMDRQTLRDWGVSATTAVALPVCRTTGATGAPAG